MALRVDRELEEFRDLMAPPSSFEDGFNWRSLAGALFVAMLMVPGAIYMGLLGGQEGGMSEAARWVTVILFIEVARRAQTPLRRSEVYILYYMAAMAMGVPFSGLLWNQFFARSQAAMANGIASQLPTWYAPAADSASYAARSFFHPDWLPAVALVVFSTLIGHLSNTVLGYGLFRLTSDIEKLPFPMAPLGVQGIMALAEDAGERESAAQNWRWRVFAIGGALGLAFATIYYLIPQLTGAMTNGSATIQLFTIPFVDTTAKTQNLLPAVATGWCWDAGQLVVGMVLPFFAVIGTAVGVIAIMIANPIMYRSGVLHTWQPGDDTIITQFKNYIYFYFSFGIGIGIAIAVVGIMQMVLSLRRRRKDMKAAITADAKRLLAPPDGRGDIPPFWIFLCYFLVVTTFVLLSGWLINWHKGVMLVLIFFGFFYTPLISYVTARLEGMVGQAVDIPMVKEASFILSGYRGAAIWFLPVPYANYGMATVGYRQAELIGTKFTSKWKTVAILAPIILVSSFFFMNFIWSLGDVPSPVYPYANKMWDLNANQQCVMYSSTLGNYSQFEQSLNWKYLAMGTGAGVGIFGLLSWVGAPIFLMYGLVRGLGGGALPHMVFPQLAGALIGRFYFRKRLGLTWQQYVPVVAAGFFCGAGLVMVLGVGLTFISKAVVRLPY